MTEFPNGCDAATIKATIKKLEQHCRAYKESDMRRALFQLVTTLVAYLALAALMLAAFQGGIYWPLIGVVPAGGLLVRLFIIQHDCGHGSFFATRRANDMTGRALSILTWTPYSFWQRAHNMHHATSGNLDKRGIGSIDTLTVAEYKALSPRKKFFYRLYRNPIVLLTVGGPLHVMALQRVPHGTGSPFIEGYHALAASKQWKSIAALDIALLVVYGALVALLGWAAVLAVIVPPVMIAAWAGGWLFYIQHQFEDAYWEAHKEWSFHEAAVLGSSYYALPKVLQWFTGNIGLHHIHHLCSAVPNYRLQECLDANQVLQKLNRMTIRDSLQCVRWALWDEKAQKMIGFRDLRTAAVS